MKELLAELDRGENSHKGENGKVAVIGGSVDFTGAPALAAEAALRTGSDLTRVLTSEKVRDVIAGYSENLIVGSYTGDYFGHGAVKAAVELSEWSDTTVVGPGLSEPDTEALKQFFSRRDSSLVVDADAIEPAVEAGVSDAVLTPHQGEAEIIEERRGSVEEFVEETGSVVVVKGSTDRIYTSERVYENGTGCAGMTVGGTGDVLAGIIASLVSRGMGLEDAARAGAWVNGKAGERACEKYGNGMVATDLLGEVAGTVSKH
ncbi:MAG: NAD(P)H-hydrate dehydratase [Candidatus Nanohaloarchaea archaeon]